MRKIKETSTQQLKSLLKNKKDGKYKDTFFKNTENKVIFEGTIQQLRVKQNLDFDLNLLFGEPKERKIDKFGNRFSIWETKENGKILLKWWRDLNSTILEYNL